MSRMGRPPGPDAERLAEVFHVRVTSDVYDAAHRQAADAGMAVGDYLREIIRVGTFRENKYPADADVS